MKNYFETYLWKKIILSCKILALAMFIFASQVVYLILSEGEQSAFICQQIRKVFHSTLFNKGTRIDFKINTSFDLDTEWSFNYCWFSSLGLLLNIAKLRMLKIYPVFAIRRLKEAGSIMNWALKGIFGIPSWILSISENLARSSLQDGATKWLYYVRGTSHPATHPPGAYLD